MANLKEKENHLSPERKDYDPVLEEVHKLSRNNRSLIEASTVAHCFYCRKSYESSKIETWVDNETTALCPLCGIDSVLPSVSQLCVELQGPYMEFTDKLLRDMYKYWFKTGGKVYELRDGQLVERDGDESTL